MSNLNLFSKVGKKTTGRRNDKIAAQIRECFSFALIKRDFPILKNHEGESKLDVPVTITYVDLSPNLRNATIFFATLGDKRKEKALKFFEIQNHFFKNLLAKNMRLRFIPDILFKLDDSFEYAQKIENLINNS